MSVEIPDELLEVLGIRPEGPPPPIRPGSPPIQMGLGGRNLNPQPPMLNAAGIPESPLPTGTALPSPVQSTRAMPALPAPPDLSNSPVTSAYKTYQDTLSQRSALKAPNPQDYKPHTGDRIKGGILGALYGGLTGDAGKGGQFGQRFTNSRFNKAAGTYGRQSIALDKQLEAERGGFGIAENAAKVPETDYTNRLNRAKEEREQNVGQGRIDQSEARAARLQDQIDNPAHKEPKNADEALSAASAASDPAEKERLLKLSHDLHKQEVDRVREGRPPKEDKPATKAQFAGLDAKKAAALHTAHNDYVKATKDLDPKSATDSKAFQDAHDFFVEAEQQAQNAYEQELSSLGGTPQHSDVSQWPGQGGPADKSNSTPAAGTKPEPKATPKVGDVVTVKGGKKVKITKLYAGGKFDADEVK